MVGPTAVGKTAAAIELAERRGGEVVSADSRYVYRYMDVGTAKPTPEERARVPHHLIDLVDPDQEYSVARFLGDANAAIASIQARGRLPIVAGGTGYWVQALLGRATSAGVPPNPELRAELARVVAEEGPTALIERLRRLDAAAAERIDQANPRRVARAIEVVETTGRPYAEALRPSRPATDALVVGLTLPRDLLYARIDARYDEMIAAGWIEEVRWLLERAYSRDLPSMSSTGYREIASYLDGELTLEETKQRIRAAGRRLARGQRRWFRPDDPSIVWIDARGDVIGEIERVIEERQ